MNITNINRLVFKGLLFICVLVPQFVRAQSIAIHSGWNLLSVPVKVANPTKSVLFPSASSSAFLYQNGYRSTDSISPGSGYWIKFGGSENVPISGGILYDDTVAVKKGWNMIGAVSFPIAVTSIQSVPGGIVKSTVYGFNSGYSASDSLRPGFGYWVKVDHDGVLVLATYNTRPGVVVFTDSTRQNLISISAEGDTLLFNGTTSGFATGQVIMSDSGEGLLRRVSLVQQVGGGTQIITIPASLTDVFTEASIEDSFTISNSMVRDIKGIIPGVRIVSPKKTDELKFSFEDAVIYDEDKNPSTTNDQVKATGSLSLQIRPKLHLRIHGSTVSELSFSVEPTAILELAVDAGFEFPVVQDSIKIGTIETSPIIFYVGYIPVVLTNEIPIYLGIDGSVKVGITAGVKNTTSIYLGTSYYNGTWTPASHFNNQFDYTPPSAKGEAQLQAYLKPQLNTKIYGIAGPMATLKGYLEGNASITVNPVTSNSELKGEVYAGVRANVGVSMNVFDVSIASWDSPLLIDARVKLFEWTDAANLAPASPFAPIPADNAIAQATALTLGWSCTDPENDPLHYDLYFGTENPPISLKAANLSGSSHDTTGLAPNTSYFWKITAKDDHGNSTSSPVWSFTTSSSSATSCLGIPTIDYAGKTYNTVQVGNQCWLRENLDVGTRINGNQSQNDNGVVEKYCFNNDPAKCDTFGGLYQWNEAMQYSTVDGVQGLCPNGWHLPTNTEFRALAMVEGYNSNSLKAIGEGVPPGEGTNTSGFTALLAGAKNAGVDFDNFGFRSLMWSSTLFDATFAYDMVLEGNNSDLPEHHYYRINGFSIRCVKEMNNNPPTAPSNPGPTQGASDQPISTQLSWACSDPDGDPVTYSVYFGTSANPSITVSQITGSSFDPGTLNDGQTYYWKIVAKDNNGDSTSGPIWSFSVSAGLGMPCAAIPAVVYAGKTYNTVQIGTQCWLKENLDIGTMVDGSLAQSNNGVIEKSCYGNDPANCTTYGGLYQWDEAMQYVTTIGAQGICPTGWHIPTWAEFDTLIAAVGNGGNSLKAVGQGSGAGAGTNTSGFSGLLGGYRGSYGNFVDLGNLAHIWSSWRQSSTTSPRLLELNSQNNLVFTTNYFQGYGYNIRCIAD